MTELKPCPFCGGEAVVRGSIVTYNHVACRKCNSAMIGDTKEEAIEKWNNRWMIPCEEGETKGYWHTGTPTEDGEYLVICQYVIDNHYYREKLVWEFENGDWKNKQRLTENNYIEELKILAWYGQKIEPYKEK